MVFGAERNFVSALVTVDPDAIAGWAEENGKAGKTYTEPGPRRGGAGDDRRVRRAGSTPRLNRWETVKKWKAPRPRPEHRVGRADALAQGQAQRGRGQQQGPHRLLLRLTQQAHRVGPETRGMSHHTHADETEEHDLGLSHDLPRIMARRGLLGLLGGVGAAAALTACGSGDTTSTAADASSAAAEPGSGTPPPAGGAMGADSSVQVAEGEIPEETAGPYPGDGSNGPDVLSESGVVRSDITSRLRRCLRRRGGGPGDRRLKVYDLNGDEITPLAGAAVYLWHCDREGRYSMYDDAIADENYLRGVQEADANGEPEPSPRSSRRATPGAGRTCTSRSTRAWRRPPRARRSLRTSQARPARGDLRRRLRHRGLRAERDQPEAGSRSTPTASSATATRSRLAKVTGSVDEGYTVTLNVPV
ncbi:hypothetical protein [Nocardioides convexus]|uniref:hypothetical protein n=1 Tax=Nocardioides convexus TaxID=2712224 RepID=UPI003100EB65